MGKNLPIGGFLYFLYRIKLQNCRQGHNQPLTRFFPAVCRTSREPTELRMYEDGNQECVSSDLMAEVQLFQGVSVEKMPPPGFTPWNHVNGFPNYK